MRLRAEQLPAALARGLGSIYLISGDEPLLVSEAADQVRAAARKAGYLNNKKYDTDPQAMLYARAAGDVARKIAPDALLGMAYSIEELQLLPDDEPAAPTARSGSVRLAAAVGITPPQPELAEPTDEDIAAINAEANADVPDLFGDSA